MATLMGRAEAVARFLEKLGFEPIILHEQANQGRTIIEKFEKHSDVGFAVVLLTPDDIGGAAEGSQKPLPRQNVILELGYFIGRLGRERVCALKTGDLELPSDILGVVWTAFDEAGGWKQGLAKENKAAAYKIDWNRVMRL
jgi:predicted nucleotide-binding protein